MDDVNEVTFIEKGLYDIGYEINKQEIFKIRMPNRSVLGTFEVCFDKRMLFIFKTYSECKGFFIRKLNFQKLEQEFSEFYQSIKMKALFHYVFKIRRPMLAFKEKDIEFFNRRADFKQVLALRDYDEDELRNLVEDFVISHGDKNTTEE